MERRWQKKCHPKGLQRTVVSFAWGRVTSRHLFTNSFADDYKHEMTILAHGHDLSVGKGQASHSLLISRLKNTNVSSMYSIKLASPHLTLSTLYLLCVEKSTTSDTSLSLRTKHVHSALNLHTISSPPLRLPWNGCNGGCAGNRPGWNFWPPSCVKNYFQRVSPRVMHIIRSETLGNTFRAWIGLYAWLSARLSPRLFFYAGYNL